MPSPTTSIIGSYAAATLLLVALAGSLTVDSILSSHVYLLALGGLVLIGWGRIQGTTAAPTADREIKLIGFAFTFFALISLCSWTLNGFGYEGFKDLGKHGRFFLFWPLFVVISRSKLTEKPAFLGLLLGATIAGVIAIEQSILGGSSGARAKGATNPIPFGNLSLLMGMALLVVLPVLHRERRWTLFIGTLVATVLAFAAAYQSGTRNNLIAFPALLLLIMAVGKPGTRFLPAIFGGLAFALVLSLDSRLSSGLSDLVNGAAGNGIRLRLEVWLQAISLFYESPLIGIGSQGYADAIREGATSGQLDRALADCCADHAHNDLFHILATRGLLGAFSWGLLLLIPFVQFARFLRHEDSRTSAIAAIGCLIPLGYLIFGFTAAPLMRGIYISFYLLTITTLIHLLSSRVERCLTNRRKQTLSTIIITYNEADNIHHCLTSVQPVSDEIIVLDSGSTDGTTAIAEQFTDNVFVTDWPGFGPQKQRALERATGSWVLSIDADERLTPYLAKEINHELSLNPRADAYKLPWAVTLYGKRLDFGRSARAPLRLFRREAVSFSNALVHEKILIPKGRKTATLRGRLTHYTHRNFGHALEKNVKYSWLGSQEKFRKGARTRTLLYPTLRALLTFLHIYIGRLGLLDGSVGYLVSITYAQGTFNKYAGVWTLTRTGNGEGAD